ncbi:hypothetical protein M9H77_07492 [Catharanthus roseus]|uniref:Uncharacterized protein n=1 Tax=Catharanthus roseus TaxID=4058 RepID=A0ACC0BVB8_CATRO|nr:hypothetical protein M9H77_07492 [Catharanthus roseus]
MTEVEQMNGHRADERSPSSGYAVSRRWTYKGERGPARDRNTENAGTEKSSSSAAREKVEELERVQVELKETERSNEETVKRRRGRDYPRNEEAEGLNEESSTQPGWLAQTGPSIS